MIDLNAITGFNWDDGNARKNEKHGVAVHGEARCSSTPLCMLEDAAHSDGAPRPCLWQDGCRVPCTSRSHYAQSGALIRVISTRDMHRKERAIYEQNH